MDREKVEKAVKDLIEAMGFDSESENFKETPRRFADFLEELFTPKITEDDYVTFSSAGNLVIAKDVNVFSLCPHHLLPVIYKVNIAYLPHGKVVGVSKLARVAMDLARKLPLQEDFTEQIADGIVNLTGSNDVMVVVRGKHFCMVMRGVRQENSEIVTSSIRGSYFSSKDLRDETLSLMK